MDLVNALKITVPLVWAVASIATAFCIGAAVKSALSALTRQPEMFGKILILMILGCALIETIMLYIIMLTYPLISKL